MYSEYWFSDLTGSLQGGFFADDVILALAKVQASKKISPDERGILKRAADLLEMALKGHAWLDNPRITEQSGTCASLFGQAVRALPAISTSEVFVRNLGDLKRTALDIAEGRLPKENKIDALRKFFFNASQLELDRTEQLLEHEPEPGVLGFFGVSDTEEPSEGELTDRDSDDVPAERAGGCATTAP